MRARHAARLELIAPELALFVALVPVVKLFKRENATRIEKMIAAVIEVRRNRSAATHRKRSDPWVSDRSSR